MPGAEGHELGATELGPAGCPGAHAPAGPLAAERLVAGLLTLSSSATRASRWASPSAASCRTHSPTARADASFGLAASIASEKASAVGNRSARSRWSARRMTPSSAGDRSGRSLASEGTSAARTWAMVAPASSPWKSRREAQSSQSTAPAAKTSAARSMLFGPAASCSGAMYETLPLSCSPRVTWRRLAALATPKSTRRARPSWPTRMLWGETSRWTIPSGSPRSPRASCAACSPARTPIMIAEATGMGTGSPRLRAARSSAASESPRTYSITMKISPPSATTSSVATTLGWWMRAASCASSRNMSTNSGSRAICGCMRLTATTREKPTGPTRRPKYTVAIPPDAISPWSA